MRIRIATMKFAVVVFLFLAIAGCGGGGGDSENPDALPRFDVRGLESLYPYSSQGPYRDVLKDCALITRSENGCSLQRLPFIGQSGNAVTRAGVMDRVLVTHEWMGRQFDTLLEQAPDDMLQLFASVTSISIGSTVRPSNYWIGTGGIRLDPAFLWMSLEEKANVSVAEDFRSGYGKELNFVHLQSSRINGQRAYPYHTLTSYDERTLEDLRIRVYSLLYHELGHAVDYMHPDLMQLVDTSSNPADAIEAFESYRASTQLAAELPLRSTEMLYLAQVKFQGYIATEQQKQYTPADVGSFMGSEGAIKFYSYNTEREDFANLLELAMMKKQFDVDFLMGYSVRPADNENPRCSELILGWGQHNRLSDPFVLPRAKWVLEKVYGSISENDEFIASNEGLKREMTSGLNWCENRDGIVASEARRFESISALSQSEGQSEQLRHELQQGHH